MPAGNGSRCSASSNAGRGAFTGKVVMTGSSTGFIYPSGYNASGVAGLSVVEMYTGSATGVLFGDKGKTMRCKLQYADSSGFTPTGGVGLCETSDGRVVDVQW